MAASGSRRCLVLVVSSFLAKCVQYLLFDQLPFTVEASCSATKPYIGNSFAPYTVADNVPSPLELRWAKLVFNRGVHNSTTAHRD